MATAMHGSEHARHIAILVANHKRGNYIEEEDFSVCLQCHQPAGPGKKLLQCSKCKAVRYCSAACATLDWKGTTEAKAFGYTESHREICPVIQASQQLKPQLISISKQFPFTRERTDGTFTHDVYRSIEGIMGSGKEFGFWTEPPCCNANTPYLVGSQLLEKRHLTSKQGWKVKDEWIPWLEFEKAGVKTPSYPPKFEDSWKSYYAWRGLPLESPAVLLLHWPMTVYRLLSLLGLVPPQPPSSRQKLTVHYVGVESELDFLPIYGELALLFPNTDLDLVFFGSSVRELVNQARRRGDCLASQKYVYSYTAPSSLGSGTLRISFFQGGPLWEGDDARSNPPDAIIACHAGICSYQPWLPVVLTSRALGIPMAVTDYNQVTMHTDIQLIFRNLPKFSTSVPWKASSAGLSLAEKARLKEGSEAEYVSKVNPFMLPGPRRESWAKVVASKNAFTLVVTPQRGSPSEDGIERDLGLEID